MLLRRLAPLVALLALSSCDPPTRASLDAAPSGSVATPGSAVVVLSVPVSGSATTTASGAPTMEASASGAPSSAPTAAPSTPPIADPTKPLEAAFLGNAKDGILKDGVADTVIAPGRTSAVLLVSAGAEPHEPLRYKFAENAKQTTLMRTSTTMVAPQRTVTLPTVEMTLELSTGARDTSTDRVPVKGTLTSVEVKPTDDPTAKQMAAAMGAGLQIVKGLNVAYSVDSLGRAADVSLKLAGASNPQTEKLVEEMRRQFESLVPPLPEQPVGEGAEWQVIQRVSTGVEILQWTNYKLTQKKGDKIKLTATVQQLAASPKVVTPQSSVPVMLLSYDGSGSAATSMALSSIVPDAGLGSVKNVIRFEEAGKPISTETLVKLEFERKK